MKTDGKTPYERLRGREYKGQVIEPFEVCHYKLEGVGKMEAQTNVGVWLGKSKTSDEHLMGTLEGIRRCRSFQETGKQKVGQVHFGCDEGISLAAKGPANSDESTSNSGKTGTPRRGVYITLERQIEHGATPACPGRSAAYEDNPKPHSAECRARFEKLLGRTARAPGILAPEARARTWRPEKEQEARARLREDPCPSIPGRVALPARVRVTPLRGKHRARPGGETHRAGE